MADVQPFTEQVRQELAALPLATNDLALVRAELSGILRAGGSLHRSGSGPMALLLTTGSGAVARRTHGLTRALTDVRPEVGVRTGGMRGTSYRVAVPDTGELASQLGLLDAEGNADLPWETTSTAGLTAYARGVFLARGSFTRPGRPVHVELVVGNAAIAAALARRLGDLLDAHLAADPQRGRVVLKSGPAAGDLLVALGATSAFLMWDDRQLRRQLHQQATRLANADAANLRRAVSAAAGQVHAVERLVALFGWEGIDDDLRPVALARLTNPDASLADLAELCDPPLSRTTLHRRLRQLEEAAADLPP